MASIHVRLKRLEQQIEPERRIIVLHGDEPAPANLPEGTVIIRVIYGRESDEQRDN
jgi:hypothetical protein